MSGAAGTGHVFPEGAADCHVHIYGPFDRYPEVPISEYKSPDAPVERLLALWDGLGIARGVIVHARGRLLHGRWVPLKRRREVNIWRNQSPIDQREETRRGVFRASARRFPVGRSPVGRSFPVGFPVGLPVGLDDQLVSLPIDQVPVRNLAVSAHTCKA